MGLVELFIILVDKSRSSVVVTSVSWERSGSTIIKVRAQAITADSRDVISIFKPF